MPDSTSYTFGHPTQPVDTIESLRALNGVKDRLIAELTVKLDALAAAHERAEAETIIETGTEEAPEDEVEEHEDEVEEHEDV